MGFEDLISVDCSVKELKMRILSDRVFKFSYEDVKNFGGGGLYVLRCESNSFEIVRDRIFNYYGEKKEISDWVKVACNRDELYYVGSSKCICRRVRYHIEGYDGGYTIDSNKLSVNGNFSLFTFLFKPIYVVGVRCYSDNIDSILLKGREKRIYEDVLPEVKDSNKFVWQR